MFDPCVLGILFDHAGASRSVLDWAIFGRSYAAEPDVLIEQLRKDEAIRRSRYSLAYDSEPIRRCV